MVGSSLLVVIVNFKAAGLTIDCLRSLADEVGSSPGTGVVVTDNASGDGSAERLETAVAENGWASWASVMPLGRNGGFACGNNAALRPALQSADPPRYVLLLNPDTIVRSGALKALIDFMESRPDVGIAGSRLEDPDGAPQPSAFRFPSVLSEFEGGVRLGLVSRLLSRWIVAPPTPQGVCRSDWVSGACMIVRRELFEAIGLLDEGYFMYFEEVDFCRRACRAGWPCWYVPEARVVHLVGQCSGFQQGLKTSKRRPTYWFDSRRRYFRTHLGPYRSFVADSAWTLGFLSFRIRQVIQRKPDLDSPRLLRDFVRHNFHPQGG